MKINQLRIDKNKNGYVIHGDLNGEQVRIAQINRAPNMTTETFNKAMSSLITNLSDRWERGFDL